MTVQGVLIREFRMSDLDTVIGLLPKSFAQEFEINGMDPVRMREIAKRAYGITGRLFLVSSRLVGKEPFKFLVAEMRNEVVGTTMVSRRGTVGYISTVMVSPDFRRKGIASSLMKAAVKYIQGRKMGRAVLHVISTNAPALALYSKLGFEAFEEVAYVVGEPSSSPTSTRTNDVEVRPFAGNDLDEVYDLQVASEDPNHMRVFDLRRSQLKTPLAERLFRLSTRKTMVAVRAGKIVGSVVASYTIPTEAGSIGSIQVKPGERSTGIEVALVAAALDEIRKGGASKAVATVSINRPEVIEALNGFGLAEAMRLVGMSRETRT